MGLNGFGSSTSHGGASQSLSLPVTAGDVVVVQAALNPESEGFAPAAITVTSSPQQLTFQTRMMDQRSNSDATWMWEEWAAATATGTLTITVDLTLTGVTIDCSGDICPAWSVIGYSVSGCPTPDSPWDPDPNLPYKDFNDCNSVDGCSDPVYTSSAYDFVIFGIGSEGNPTVTAPAGWSMIADVNVASWMANAVAYQVYSSPQSGTPTGNWVLNPGESALWYVDAIVISEPQQAPTTLALTASVV